MKTTVPAPIRSYTLLPRSADRGRPARRWLPAQPGIPERVRAIVRAAAQTDGTKAVEFGIWVHDREILTTALGNSMTTVPATTDMHYRIGGIAETFMSTLLLMLVEQGRIGLDEHISRWFPKLLAADQVTVRMLVIQHGRLHRLRDRG